MFRLMRRALPNTLTDVIDRHAPHPRPRPFPSLPNPSPRPHPSNTLVTTDDLLQVKRRKKKEKTRISAGCFFLISKSLASRSRPTDFPCPRRICGEVTDVCEAQVIMRGPLIAPLVLLVPLNVTYPDKRGKYQPSRWNKRRFICFRQTGGSWSHDAGWR